MKLPPQTLRSAGALFLSEASGSCCFGGGLSSLLGRLSGLLGRLSGLLGGLSGLLGRLSGLLGRLSGLFGGLSGLFGRLSGLLGRLSDLFGRLSGLFGRLSDLFGRLSGLLGGLSGLLGGLSGLLGGLGGFLGGLSGLLVMGGVGYGVDQVPFGIVELFTANGIIPVVGDLLATIALEVDSLGRIAFCIIEALVGTASSVRRVKAGFLDRDTIVIDLSGTVLEKVVRT